MMRAPSRRMKLLYLSLALLFFVLAVLGVFLPVLPATPFLLLTSWCLLRSSPRWHARLHRSPLFGPILHDWEVHRGVRLHVKCTAVAVIAVAAGASLAFGSLSTTASVALIVLAAIGLGVGLRLPVVRA